MAESQNHMDLVKNVQKYVESIVPDDMHGLIQCDSPTAYRPPKVIGGFIPDVFFWYNDLLIIGEAKTLNDFDNRHCKAQLEAYYKECAKFYGEAILVISVPWQLVFSVKNYFKNLKRLYPSNFSIVVINELEWREKI